MLGWLWGSFSLFIAYSLSFSGQGGHDLQMWFVVSGLGLASLGLAFFFHQQWPKLSLAGKRVYPLFMVSLAAFAIFVSVGTGLFSAINWRDGFNGREAQVLMFEGALVIELVLSSITLGVSFGKESLFRQTTQKQPPHLPK